MSGINKYSTPLIKLRGGIDLRKGIKQFLVLKVPKRTVSPVIMKWKEYGTTQTLPRACRPTKLSNWVGRTLVREVTTNPMTTLTELQSSLAEMGEPAGRTTITAARHKSRIYGRMSSRKQFLRKRHMTAHLEFAKRNVKD